MAAGGPGGATAPARSIEGRTSSPAFGLGFSFNVVNLVLVGILVGRQHRRGGFSGLGGVAALG